MKMTKLFYILPLLVISLVLLVFAIRHKTGMKPPADTAMESPRIAIPMIKINLLAILAVELGYFQQQGVAPIIKEYPSGKDALDSFLLNETNLAFAPDMPIVVGSLKRQDFKIVATITSANSDHQIIARKDRGIEKPLDLKGKRVAVQKASASHFFLHLFLLKYGLQESDITLIYKKTESLPESLASGEIDAFSAQEPYMTKTVQRLKNNAIRFEEQGLYQNTLNLITCRALIQTNPALIRSILKALLQAEAFAREHQEEAIQIASAKLGIPSSEILQSWSSYDFSIKLDQSLLLTLEDESRWLSEGNLIDMRQKPNFLDFIYLVALKHEKPESVTIPPSFFNSP
jgi:NitT/TauT family transport system substrate-binding protein